MSEKLSSLLRSKTGFAGFVLFLVGAVSGLLSVLQDVDYARDHVGGIAEFLQTGAGNLLFMGGGIALVLWAVFVRQSGELRASEQEHEDFDVGNSEPNKTHFKDEPVYLSEIARTSTEYDRSRALKGLTFDNCIVHGPAILAFKNTDNFSGENIVGKSDWNNSKKERFWKADRDYEKHAGATVLEDCVFRECRFRQVGLLIDPEKYEEGRRLGVLD